MNLSVRIDLDYAALDRELMRDRATLHLIEECIQRNVNAEVFPEQRLTVTKVTATISNGLDEDAR